LIKKIRNIIVVLLVLELLSCSGIETLPVIPYIEFKEFTLSEDVDDLGNKILSGLLLFTFQDGDGDVGLHEPDTIMPGDTSNFNLFFTLYEKIEGEYIEVPEEELGAPLYYRIPFIEREGQNKTLKGDIEVEFEYLEIEYDTIRYSFYILDRQLHKSNVDTTPDISFTGYSLDEYK